MSKDDEARHILAETVHTAFRKGADGPGAHAVWTAIRDIPREEWHNALCWMLWCFNEMGWELRKKLDD